MDRMLFHFIDKVGPKKDGSRNILNLENPSGESLDLSFIDAELKIRSIWLKFWRKNRIPSNISDPLGIPNVFKIVKTGPLGKKHNICQLPVPSFF